MIREHHGEPLSAFVAACLASAVERGTACLLAVSGGGDSLALLDLLHRARALHGCSLIVGHVDHGLNDESPAVAHAVGVAAMERQLPFVVRRLELPPLASETRARAARRAALLTMARESGAAVIVLAHHADDQAETLLLRLLHGSGPAGLAGMPLRHGPWVRPMLGVRRAVLDAHLAGNELRGWQDPANRDSRHLRSWLRQDVLPAIEQRLPEAVSRINRTARQAADARLAWTELLPVLPGLDFRRQNRGISVAAGVVNGYRSPLRHAVLAALAREVGVVAGPRRLVGLDRLLENRKGAGSLALDGSTRVELAFDRLTFYQVSAVAVDAVRLGLGRIAVGGQATFLVRGDHAGVCDRGGWTTWLEAGEYEARSGRAGDRIRPLGGTGTRPVAVLLREARIPPAERRQWPVVIDAANATIVWVPGICRADARVPAEGTEAWHVECVVA